MIFLAGRDRHTQRTLLRSIHDRLSKHPGVKQVRYRPSRRRPRYVVADIDPPVFLGDSCEAETARLELRFWYPEGVEYEYYRLNWVEPDRELMVGFHQDGDHSDLGPCHLQVDHEGEALERHAATFHDEHPLAVLEHRLREFPTVLAALDWSDGRPSLGDWSP
jgi:hypothetical protein